MFSILTCQEGLRNSSDSLVDIYVGIPFCLTRCSYCSFTSGEIGKLKQYVEPYVEKLAFEITQSIELAHDNGFRINNVYFGGGTPTSLSASQLNRLLSLFDFPIREFTVEAGRPDTIDLEKLEVLSRNNVHRISINPQSFNDQTLRIVGRNHTSQDIIEKFNLARKFDFDINMDLIAGLPQESYEMFRHSVDQAISLNPDNITVHSLALKKGSILKENDALLQSEQTVSDMIDYSHSRLLDSAFLPYYMYRQKYVSANLENVGFCREGKQCLYNIDIMEETTSIMACGCNAISKRVFHEQNRIERQANPKDVITYLNNFDVYLTAKKKLFEK